MLVIQIGEFVMKRIMILVGLFAFSTATVSAQWIQQQSGVTVNLNGVWFTSPLKGWVDGQNGTIMMTTNGGATWSQQSSPTTSNLNRIWFADTIHGWIAGDGGTILSTTNGGASWQQNYDGGMYSGNYYGVFASNHNGQIESWVAGGNNGNAYTVIEKVNNYGQWSPQIMGFAGRLTGIYFVNDSLGWATGDSNLILSTTNGGKWWNQGKLPPLPPLPYYQGLCDVKFFTPQVGLCAGNADAILRSTDGGTSWNVVQLFPHNYGIIFRVVVVNDSVAYAVGDTSSVGGNGTIERTTDQGQTWVFQSANTPPSSVLSDIHFVDNLNGWAVGLNGLILHTTNGGGGKLLLTPSLLAPMTNDTLAAQDTALVWDAVPTATSYEVQIALDSAFSNIVADSKSISDTALILKGLYNTVLNSETKYFWRVKAMNIDGTSPFSSIWSFVTPTLTSINGGGLPKKYQLDQNYPNPFNPTTVISYGMPKNSFVKLAIYDELGREVKVLVNQEETAGNHSVNFDASTLPSGIYFYRIQTRTFTQTKKLVLLK
jgi:photosystem II stability/assembly factor-like uncharacterized protein